MPIGFRTFWPPGGKLTASMSHEDRNVPPAIRDPFANGVSRRRFLGASTAAGTAAATAGCVGTLPGTGDGGDGAPSTYVFNTGDRTLSVIDAEADELVTTTFIGTTASFPANQYSLPEAGGAADTLWLNVDGGVTGLDANSLDEVASITTGFGPNYPNVTPDGKHLLVAAGGTTTLDPNPEDPPDHKIVRVDADRESDSFGAVTGELAVGYTGPCDMSMGPEGNYGYVPDVVNDTLSVVSVDPFEVVTKVPVEPVGDGNSLPFMGTVSFGGDILLTENGEGELGPEGDRPGSESIWDLSDPENPEELARITRDDGLPSAAITSEIGPDGAFAYLFTPGAGTVTVLDIENREIASQIDVGGVTLAGTWEPNREKLYVPVQSEDEVAVIDHANRELKTTISVGKAPVGATAGTIRPEVDSAGNLQAAIASVGIRFGDPTATFCPMSEEAVDCFCGIWQDV